MIRNVDNLLLNETEQVRKDFLAVKTHLNTFGIDLKDSNQEVVFANHLLELIHRLQNNESIIEYYFEDDRQVAGIKRHALVISEKILEDLFNQYERKMIYSEVIMTAAHLQLILDDSF